MQNIQEKSGISKLVIVASVVAVVLVAGLAVFYVSSGSSPSAGTNITCGSSAPSGSSSVQVSITSRAANSVNAPGYSPDKITLMIGTNNTVTWTNKDTTHHTVSTSAAPTGASFDSGNMIQGATYTCRFTTPGTYQYYCKYHSCMTGTIVVVS